LLLAGLSPLVLTGSRMPGTPHAIPGPAFGAERKILPSRLVFLAGGLADDEVVQLGSCLAAGAHPGIILLLDAPTLTQPNRAFLEAFQPGAIIPVGTFPRGVAELQERVGMKTAPLLEWKGGPPLGLWQLLFPHAERVVVCPAKPRPLYLQAACLAGALRAPLVVLSGQPGEAKDLQRRLDAWKSKEVYLLGTATALEQLLPGVRALTLADEPAVAAAFQQQLAQKEPIHNLVAANPADAAGDLGRMSCLAPWIALQRRAALVLTSARGDNVTKLIHDATSRPELAAADTLILAAGLKAIPTERRPNPAAGKDADIEMEPLTPRGEEPFSFATGRLFHEEPGMVALLLARQQLLHTQAHAHQPRKALVVSNPGGSLPLLETFSRHTARELQNRGYETATLFNSQVSAEAMRRLMPEQDLFLWEGHYRTLVDSFQFLTWDEPLPPSLCFLQSCLALQEKEAHTLYRRGVVGIVGSSTRTYSGSGGAFSLAYFDALLYDKESLGGALRQSKNFLLMYSLLKKKRLGNTPLAGANIRSAWAFSLWGDPTLRLPAPPRPAEALAHVQHQVRGDKLVVKLPQAVYENVAVGHFHASMRPNARLAGLITRDEEPEGAVRHLVPFVFVEVHLPDAAGRTPQLECSLPERSWVFNWDARRQMGYLLVTPRPRGQKELYFQVKWG